MSWHNLRLAQKWLYAYAILLFDLFLFAAAAETHVIGRSQPLGELDLEFRATPKDLAARAATPVLPLGWSSTSRCMTDASTGARALAGNSMTSYSLTLDQCVDFCDQTGFQYAGAEYGSQCYCSNTISTANGGGVEVASSECSTNCAGNSQQKCGATYRMTLFSKKPTSILSGWVKNFCTKGQNAGVLTGYSYSDSTMTPAVCINTCAQRGFVLAGVETGNKCYCGNTVDTAYPTKDADCKTVCSGDSSQYCGGGGYLMVYIKVPSAPSGSNAWTLTSGGTSGVVMIHVAVTSNDTVLVIDRKQSNPLLKANGKPAWGAVWSLKTNTARPLNIITHSFCSSGSFLSNGTFANFGGHEYTSTDGEATNDGLQGTRFFNPCAASENCDIYENPNRIRLSSNRWYPTSARLPDGSAIIIGGQTKSDWTNSASLNNPTYEFFPAKNINGYNGLQIPSQFLKDTLPHNTYPHVYTLPTKKIFVAANNQAMLLDWEKNTETRLPNFPNGQRVAYPMNAAGVLLPLSPANNYTAEMFICGGSHISDTLPPTSLDANHDYSSAQCSRMALDAAGIAGGWKVEYMPEPRLLADGVLLPNGKVLIVNGGRTGTAGYGNLQHRIGDSNADNPTFTPLLYDPSAPAGQRFSSENMPTSNIGRLYHSTATLLPSGAVMIGGSNPNGDMQTRPWASEYRVEYLNPPYMTAARPTYAGLPARIDYGASFSLTVSIPSMTAAVNVVLMDLGFITHSVHMDQKAVGLVSTVSADRRTISIVAPPNAPVYSPGPGWIFVVADGIPSVAQKIMIGSGASPPVDNAATANMLAKTSNPISGPHWP